MTPADAATALHRWTLALPLPYADARTLGRRRVRPAVERCQAAALALRCHAGAPLTAATREDVARALATLRATLPADAPRELTEPVLRWAAVTAHAVTQTPRET